MSCKEKDFAASYNGAAGRAKNARYNPSKNIVEIDFYDKNSNKPIVIDILKLVPLNAKARKQSEEAIKLAMEKAKRTSSKKQAPAMA